MLPTLDAKRVAIFQSNIIDWFADNGRSFPWRQTRDPFHVLIAEVVLKLTGAWKAEQVYNYLIDRFGSPERMANANLEELTEIFKPLGLFNRARMLIDIAKQLNCQYNRQVPKRYTELTSVKGIGRYTANAILCLAYDERVPLVDGSVSRLFRRFFNYSTNKEAYADKELWQLALELLPKFNYREYNLGLLDVGAIICKHPKTICSICPVKTICARYKSALKFANLEASVAIE